MNQTKLTTTFSGPRLVAMLMTAGVVVVLTLMPRAIVAPIRAAFMDKLYLFAAPLVEQLTFIEMESTLNALVFVPLGASLAIIFAPRLWLLAPVIAFGVSFTVEYLQAQVPGRVPDSNDIVWNTIGGLAGACIVALVRLIRGRIPVPTDETSAADHTKTIRTLP